MLSNTLNTNEIKNSAGTEVEFEHLSGGIDTRTRTFRQITESYPLPNRLDIRHVETGSGIKKIRRSQVRFNKTVMSTVDVTLPVVISIYQVAVIPVGALLASTEVAHVNAQLGSFMYSLGASTTILYDGTGNGSNILIGGGL
jgi:hypothetical protein